MRLIVSAGPTVHEIDLTKFAPDACLADLVEAAGQQRPGDDESVWVDDVRCGASDRIDDVTLLEGCTIGSEPVRSSANLEGWTATLTGGMHAGAAVPVPLRRRLVIGRAPQADIVIDSPSASWEHTRIVREDEGLRVTDCRSTNGTFVDGIRVEEDEGVLVERDALITVGGATVLLRKEGSEPLAPRPGSLHNQTRAGTVPFNRPPRPGQPAPPEQLVPPERKKVTSSSKFSVATVLGPIVLAVGMVVVMGNPRYAMISMLSPFMAVFQWIEQKRRSKKERKEEDERFAKACEQFTTDLADAVREERERLRGASPDPATLVRIAELPATTLWQRRPEHPDFLSLHAGTGTSDWTVPVDRNASRHLDDDVKALIDASRVTAAPIRADLADSGVVGVVGEREDVLAVARSLVVQAAVQSGPADLSIGVYCDPGRQQAWEWATWLPHTRCLGGVEDRWLSCERSRSETQLRSLRDEIDGHPVPEVLLVIDSDVLLEGREAPARELLGHARGATGDRDGKRVNHVPGIVIASAVEQLPAACTTIVEVREDGAGVVTYPSTRTTIDDAVLAGIDLRTAREAAVALSRFEDPELVVPGAALPSLVRLPPLLGIDEITPGGIEELWAHSRGTSTPIGIGENGPFELDLVRDGPHGLVGGTTGSGKSEFLRSLISGLAARNDPTKLTFILIDFKGGAAFKPLEALPHTIGTISNLDEQLADRALRALEAEMDYRQRMFAAAGEGVDNLDAYLATNPSEPMPRLLLVVDEFAMLAKDFPDVLTSLVSIGAVGRTLGVHMILATQRPAGVVNDDILANTNLRVALRVQSKEDSNNVIGVPHAAAISRSQKGRSWVKLGQEDITPVQTALVTGRAEAVDAVQIEYRDVVFGAPGGSVSFGGTKGAEVTEADMDLMIEAIIEASDHLGIASPRPVWPTPLGARVDLAGFTADDGLDAADAPGGQVEEAQQPVVGGTDGTRVALGLSDDPDHQRQVLAHWDMSRGNAMFLGIPGSGTSTTLMTVALALADELPPDEMDLIILDMGAGDLAPLQALPHTIGYAGSGSGSREQQTRLLRHLKNELDRRKADPTGDRRRIVFLLDGLATLRDEYQDIDGMALLDSLYRVYADGPELGIWTAVATSRAKSIPSAVDEVTTQRWLFHLADRYDYALSGIKAIEAPPPVPGRCVGAETKLQTHVATPHGGVEAAVGLVRGRWGSPEPKRSVVATLPTEVAVIDCLDAAQLTGEPWRLPIGLRGSDLTVGALETYEGEHMLVAGPARSGKSTVLLAVAEVARAAAARDGVELSVWGLCMRRSPLVDSPLLDQVSVGRDGVSAVTAQLRLATEQVLLLIDDAEQFDDSDKSINSLIESGMPTLHIVAAGRSDDLRSLYSHWTKTLRKSRCGILLQPNVDYDGDLLGARLPRRATVPVTIGRGYMCMSGTVELVQTAGPTAR